MRARTAKLWKENRLKKVKKRVASVTSGHVIFTTRRGRFNSKSFVNKDFFQI